MDDAIISRIAKNTAIAESSVSATVGLVEKGATGPFIVRYRKEATGGLDIGKVSLIQEQMDYYRELRDRRTSLLKSLSEQSKLTDEIRGKIENCFTKVELDDLHQRFRSKKKNRLKEAIAKGLQPLSRYFLDQDLDAWSIEDRIQVFVDASKDLSTPEEALLGCVDILAEWIGENYEYRRTLREMLEKEGFVISNVVPAKVNQKTKYTMYYDRRESVTTIPSHRVLAIRRGCKEGILISSIEADHAKALDFLHSSVIKDRESIFAPVLEAAVRESYTRILKPLIETEVRTQLKEHADREAIRVFQENLTNLLLSPPAGPIVVMGVDWGKNNECSVAVVDESGAFLEGTKVRFTPSGQASKDKKRKTTARDTAISSNENNGQQPNSETPADTTESEQKAAPPAAASPDSSTAVKESETSTTDNEAETATVASEHLSDSIKETDVAANDTPDTEQPSSTKENETPNTKEETGKDEQAIQTTLQTEPTAPSEEATEEKQPDKGSEEKAPHQNEPPSNPSSKEASDQPAVSDTDKDSHQEQSNPDMPEEPESQSAQEAALLTDTPPVLPINAPVKEEERTMDQIPTSNDPVVPKSAEDPFETTRKNLKGLITKHKVQAIAIGAGTRARELETSLKRILVEESLGDIMIAAVNDAGIAIYSSSRVARDEFPDWTPSARCAASLARRLQNPLSELVKIDPKLIGVGQYQHDVDQKELHRKLLRTVQYCVNKVGVDVNNARESLLRYVSGLNEKVARRIIAYRKNAGPFASRESLATAIGIDSVAYQQAVAFLRIPNSDSVLDRTAIHPESYPIVERMASSLEVKVSELIGNREKITNLKLEDYITDTVEISTLKDIREELLKPGRDPRRHFKLPKFRTDVTEMSGLKEGMALEGIVTNVTNFGAFVDIGVQQDGLVHLSQMSNRFIRDPREAVKVGDIVKVKVLSVEPETKRIGLSIKALLPSASRKRRKLKRHVSDKPRPGGKPAKTTSEKGAVSSGDGSSTISDKKASPKRDSKRTNRDGRPSRRKNNRRSEKSDGSKIKKGSDPEKPEPSLQEKIAILQSKFRRIH